MKILAVLVLIFGLVVPTLADDITVPNGLLIIPAGSQVTGASSLRASEALGLTPLELISRSQTEPGQRGAKLTMVIQGS